MQPKQEAEADVLSTASASTSMPTERKWVRICADAELEEGGARMINFETENEQVAVFRHRGKLWAIDNRCAHMGASLCDGDVEDVGTNSLGVSDSKPTDGMVRCCRHHMCFNLRTGEHVDGGHMKQKVYPVRVSDGDIEVEVELEAPSPEPKATSKEATSVSVAKSSAWLLCAWEVLRPREVFVISALFGLLAWPGYQLYKRYKT